MSKSVKHTTDTLVSFQGLLTADWVILALRFQRVYYHHYLHTGGMWQKRVLLRVELDGWINGTLINEFWAAGSVFDDGARAEVEELVTALKLAA